MFWFILVLALIIIAGVAQANSKKKEVSERNERLNKVQSSVDDFKPSVTVTGIDNLYRFSVDNDSQRVLLIRNGMKTIIPFDKIMSVSIDEDNTQIMSKSSLRTVGGTLIGGALAGGAGAIVGGLSGNSTIKKKVSKVQVVLKLRDLNNPSISIDCFNARTMTIEGKNEIKNSGMNGEIYNRGLKDAQKIADLIGVIIDQVDQAQKTAQPSQKPQSSSDTIANLERLASLKEKGIITEAEFQAQKQQIIGGSSALAVIDCAESEIISDESDLPADVQEALNNGQKILAVKLYCDYTGCGLAEAKAVIDAHC
ncbi:MAG: SHOCT domain-containing protein [Lachnospiraceae bacterium]|nr:SHOCT domain-containing protein [Lachnospiraceae bacterium]